MAKTITLPDEWIWLEHTYAHHTPVLTPFALEELLMKEVGLTGKAMIHIWRHPRAFVMGLRDSKLPFAKEAKQELEGKGFQTAVRNSGGAAVPLDLGVVNITIMLPKPQGAIDFHDDFERMFLLIRDALAAHSSEVAKGEVTGSFCPGDYDLSIGGRKFCGIAQRRQSKALAVQAFNIVEGTGGDKAALARAFYDKAAAGADTGAYPLVALDQMASLSDCLGPIESAVFTRCIRQRLEAGHVTDASASDFVKPEEVADMVSALTQRYGI
ncbi:biotin/lipoate A/B protein ligase family protein [Paenibacillus larvae]